MSRAGDHRAILEGAVIGAIAPRRQIAVTGADRAAFLHGLLTNDIQALAPGSGCYAAWLTPQGRMHTDMHVLELGDMILLDVPAEQAGPTLERLDGFLFSEDVRLEALDGSLAAVWVHGPAAARVLEESLDGIDAPGTWPEHRVSPGLLDGTSVIVVRVDQLGVPGFGVYVPPASEPALRTALGHAGAVEVSQEAIDAARIEAGYPVFGLDMTQETIPLEAGIEDRAISFTKGCYVGQEVIIRVLHRGHGRVARRLVGLQFEGDPPPRAARLFAGDREIGFVTSAAASAATGAVGLGYVHRDFVQPGTAVQWQAGDARVPAVVTGPSHLLRQK
jgi:folate-binding protein YgfZ